MSTTDKCQRRNAQQKQVHLKREADILKAARELALEHGIPGTTVESIADGAGIGKGTVYKHFDSKDELFQRIAKDHMAAMLAKFSEVRSARVDPFVALNDAITHDPRMALLCFEIPIEGGWSNSEFMRGVGQYFDADGLRVITEAALGKALLATKPAGHWLPA